MSRLQKQVSQSVRVLRYIERCEAHGQDVSRLAEMREKRTAFLVAQRRCFNCGEEITNPDSLRMWEQDRLGPVCRHKVAS